MWLIAQDHNLASEIEELESNRNAKVALDDMAASMKARSTLLYEMIFGLHRGGFRCRVLMLKEMAQKKAPGLALLTKLLEKDSWPKGGGFHGQVSASSGAPAPVEVNQVKAMGKGKKGKYSPREEECWRCGGNGHLASHCPTPQGNGKEGWKGKSQEPKGKVKG